jgi:(p)ppGpp synthase/HD superfamily hydrolase
MIDIVDKAERFAATAHTNQKRKYTGDNYIVHPLEVANIVAMTGAATDEMIAAALLHDVVEDCGVSNNTIVAEFGELVAKMVFELTDQSTKADGNRAARKKIDLEHSAKMCAESATIKLADIISNSKSIFKHDKDFAVVYQREKLAMLPYLKHGNEKLFKEATALVESFKP